MPLLHIPLKTEPPALTCPVRRRGRRGICGSIFLPKAAFDKQGYQEVQAGTFLTKSWFKVREGATTLREGRLGLFSKAVRRFRG